ncbi:hypothetical protein K438DRAFT_653386 [Mycena galopus ATCC 62051]|nr:hypothetical protein K438DRAFT_653386 [Mycena galopus ATCC 62051]
MGAPTPTTTTNTSRPQSWLALAAEVALLPSIKAGSTSLRRRLRSASTSQSPVLVAFTAAAATPQLLPPCPRKSALKKPSPLRRASCPCYSTASPYSADEIMFASPGTPAIDASYPAESEDQAPPPSPTLKVALLDRVKQIHIFAPSPRHRRASRVFPDLPPPPDLDEVSVTIQSDDSDDEAVVPPMARKVRFMVPAPPPPPSPEPQLEEPAWCDFM